MQSGGAPQPIAINRDTCDHRALFDRLKFYSSIEFYSPSMNKQWCVQRRRRGAAGRLPIPSITSWANSATAFPRKILALIDENPNKVGPVDQRREVRFDQ